MKIKRMCIPLKKFILMAICCMLFSSVCSAKISVHKDEFTGGVIICSNLKTDSSMKDKLDALYWEKTLSTAEVRYLSRLHVETFSWCYFSKNPLQVNIDGSTYNVSCVGSDVFRTMERTNCLSADYMVDPTIAEKIATAKRVAIKYQILDTQFGDNRTKDCVYVLPDETLNEWKEVIRRTE